MLECEDTNTKKFKADLTAEQMEEALREKAAQVHDLDVPPDAVVKCFSRYGKAKEARFAWTVTTVNGEPVPEPTVAAEPDGTLRQNVPGGEGTGEPLPEEAGLGAEGAEPEMPY